MKRGEASRGHQGLDIEEHPFSQGDISGRVNRKNSKRTFDAQLLHVARQDSVIRSALFFSGLITGHTAKEHILAWGTLYRLMEAGKALAGAINVPFETLVDEAKLKEFTAACNNMSILGLEARHGPSSNTPPTRVLTDFDEAVSLILRFVSGASRKYLAIKYPDAANF